MKPAWFTLAASIL